MNENTQADTFEDDCDSPITGMKCPECGSTEEFYVSFAGQARVTADGSEDCGDHEWDGTDHCRCAECDHFATVAEFSGRPKPPAAISQVLLDLVLEYRAGVMNCPALDSDADWTELVERTNAILALMEGRNV